MTMRSAESAARIIGRMGRRRRRRADRRPAGSGGLIAALATASVLALAPAAQAETTSYKISQTQPAEMVLISCTGEPVALAGTNHFESNYRVTVDLSGTSFHSQALNKFSLRGTGTESGAVYQNQQEVMTEHNGTFTLDPFGGGLAPYEQTDVTNVVLIRQGETVRVDDLYVRARSHITYNANGLVITRPPTIDVICR
jgi:hypothetical protein